jgi:WD repeat and SOF domain-containing protein 1
MLVQAADVMVPCVCSLQATRLRRIVTDADNRKQQRRIQHSAPGAVKVKPDRKKKIVAELE